jgi:hypothetical protein
MTEQPKKPRHKATYATDKRNGGYLIRVAGPDANRFAGRTVPVTLKNETQHDETLEGLVWAGVDQETGGNVALYRFKAKPREDVEVSF